MCTGAHIASLFIRFIFMYMPQLIEAGKVYKAVPPLYSIPVGKNEEYFIQNIDFVKYVQKLFAKNNNLSHMNKKNMTPKECTVFFMQNQDYVYWLEKLSKTYAVNPKLMEMALFDYYNKTSFKALKKHVEDAYRFMTVKKEKDTLIYEGIIGDANILFMNDRLVNDCKPILDIIEKNKELQYRMNGAVCTIYDVMKGFEKAQPNHLQRYKGLGEMDEDQLAVSTLIPAGSSVKISKDGSNKKVEVYGNRTLIRYTLDDIKEEVGIVRQFESDFSQLFKYVGNVTRQDLLD